MGTKRVGCLYCFSQVMYALELEQVAIQHMYSDT